MSRAVSSWRVAVVGAGLAGLVCARELSAAGVQTVLFEKSQGPGGRCATRPSAAGPFDHGAWSFQAASPAFGAQLEQWHAQGMIVPHGEGWVAQPGMDRLPGELSQGLSLVTQCEIAALERAGGRWRLRAHSPWPEGLDPSFDAVVVAVPAEQALPLVTPSPALAEALRNVRSLACWTVMAAWPAPLPLKADLEDDGHPVLALARRADTRPGRPRVPGIGCRWVLHAGNYWSGHNLDAPPEDVTRRLLAALQERSGLRLARPVHAAAHRWRYAEVLEPLGEPCGWDPELRLGACGDAWHAEPGARGLERAWQSARAVARAILEPA